MKIRGLVLLLSMLFEVTGYGQESKAGFVYDKLKKIAIVIGQKDYQYEDTLSNPIYDASDFSSLLTSLGFQVYPYYNINKTSFDNYMNDWIIKIQSYDLALFYFAGHGGRNMDDDFLYPIDAQITVATDLNNRCYSVNEILGKMESSKTKINIIILDACRTMPRVRGDDYGSNWIPIQGQGSIIGYSTSAKRSSFDGRGKHSYFTDAVLRNLRLPNLTMSQVFFRVNKDVRDSTNNLQIPAFSSTTPIDPILNYVNSNVNDGSEEKEFTKNLFNVLYKIKFSSTYEQVAAFELGKQSKIAPYDSLPENLECPNSGSRYFLVPVINSKQRTDLYSFLEKKGLKEKITNDSYFVYTFQNNKLVRTGLRLFPGDLNYNLDSAFLSALGLDLEQYPHRFIQKSNGIFYISNSRSDVNYAEVLICNKEGYNLCLKDWWH